MSAIPGGAVTFDFTGTSSGVDRAARDAERRLEQMARTVNRTKIEATPAIDTKRLQKDADEAKRILQGIQKEADRLFSGRGGSGTGGGISPSGFGPLGGRGPGGSGGGGGSGSGRSGSTQLMRGVGAAAAAIAVARTLEAASAAMDEHYAKQSGNLERILAAEERRAQILRSVPLGAGALGGAIFDVVHAKERNEIADTLEGAARNDQKSAFLAEVNARKSAERDAVQNINLGALGDAGFTGTQQELARVRQQIKNTPGSSGDLLAALRQREMQLSSKDAAEQEVMEREHQSKMLAIRDEAAAEMMRAEGYTIAAERAQLVAGMKETQRAMENQALAADARGDHAAANRIRAQSDALAQVQGAQLLSHDTLQAEKEQRAIDSAGADAANFMRGAGEATVERAERQRRIAEDTAEARFEARQEMLERRPGTRARAEFEAINEKARRELAGTEDTGLRAAIRDKQAEQLKTLIADLGGAGGRQVRAEAVQNAGTTFFGTGADSKDSVRLLGEAVKLLGMIEKKEPIAVAG